MRHVTTNETLQSATLCLIVCRTLILRQIYFHQGFENWLKSSKTKGCCYWIWSQRNSYGPIYCRSCRCYRTRKSFNNGRSVELHGSWINRTRPSTFQVMIKKIDFLRFLNSVSMQIFGSTDQKKLMSCPIIVLMTICHHL